MVPEFRDVPYKVYDTVPDQPERRGIRWGWLLVAAVVVVVIGVALTIIAGCIAATILFFIGNLFVAVLPPTTKQVPREVVKKKQVAEHRSCIQCRHPIKILR